MTFRNVPTNKGFNYSHLVQFFFLKLHITKSVIFPRHEKNRFNFLPQYITIKPQNGLVLVILFNYIYI